MVNTITKSQLYAELSHQCPNVSKQTIQLVGNALFEQLQLHLTHERPVSIKNFGRFVPYYRPATPHYDIHDRTIALSVPHYRVSFKPAKKLRTALRQTKPTASV